MASSLLNNHDCWETDSVRVEFAGIVAKWCLNIVQVISKDNEAGENSVKVLVAAVVALIASTSANDNNLIPQVDFALCYFY